MNSKKKEGKAYEAAELDAEAVAEFGLNQNQVRGILHPRVRVTRGSAAANTLRAWPRKKSREFTVATQSIFGNVLRLTESRRGVNYKTGNSHKMMVLATFISSLNLVFRAKYQLKVHSPAIDGGAAF